MAKKNANVVEQKKHEIVEDIQNVDLSDLALGRYLEYAMSVVKGRALPFVHDGQKPVLRRVLYAMLELGLNNASKHKKSARVVGDVIGRFHPHGDGSVYDAMVRVAQDFSLRYPLVDGQGNFGSRDGDPAAAMRYTEARLTPIADALLSELRMDTVDFIPNYDNQTLEPALLPARLPFILLNGASGIGVGMATEIPSHNLNEILNAVIHIYKNQKTSFSDMLDDIENEYLHYSDNPNSTTNYQSKLKVEREKLFEEILDMIPGPDYPTGAIISSSPEELRKLYKTGRGSIRSKAVIRVENPDTKNWRLVVDELPYQVSCQSIMEQLNTIFNPEPADKSKKILSPEQAYMKNLFSGMIEKFQDYSDKDYPVRLVFEPKSHKQNPQEMIDTLLAFTSMEGNLPLNLVMMGKDHNPRQKNLFQIIEEWCDFRFTTVRRRTEYEYRQATWRHMILSGRLSILDHIEEVVQILKNADDPKAALKERFNLNDEQADDVLEIRLRQLARLERNKIIEEMEKLAKEIERLKKLLDDTRAMRNQIIKELEADRKLFGDDRRTKLIPSDKTAKTQIVEKTTATDDPVTVAISERGWLRVKTGHNHGSDSFQFRAGDKPLSIWKARMNDTVYMFDESGRCYNAPIWELPTKKGGEDLPVTSLAAFQTKYACSVVLAPDAQLVLGSSAGYGFLCKASDLSTRLKAGKAVLSIGKDEHMLLPAVLPPGTSPENLLFVALSTNNRMLCYRLSEINALSKGKGVALIGLDQGQQLSSIFAADQPVIYIETETGIVPLPAEEIEKHLQNRSSSKKGRGLSISGKAIRIARPDMYPSADPEPTQE